MFIVIHTRYEAFNDTIKPSKVNLRPNLNPFHGMKSFDFVFLKVPSSLILFLNIFSNMSKELSCKYTETVSILTEEVRI